MCARKAAELPCPEALQSTALIVLMAAPMLVAAAEPEVLDEDFLEYLAEFENDEDDWSWFDAENKAAELKKAASQKDEKASAKATEKVP